MERAFCIFERVCKVLSAIAGAALTFMMLATVLDVLMRMAGRPIIGTYELVALSLALVIGFSIPSVSLARSHIYMDFLVEKLSRRNRAIMNNLTRILCILLFVLIGWNLFTVGHEFQMSGEVSATIQLPFFPVAYGVGVCCFLESLVFMFEVVKIWRGEYE